LQHNKFSGFGSLMQNLYLQTPQISDSMIAFRSYEMHSAAR